MEHLRRHTVDFSTFIKTLVNNYYYNLREEDNRSKATMPQTVMGWAMVYNINM